MASYRKPNYGEKGRQHGQPPPQVRGRRQRQREGTRRARRGRDAAIVGERHALICRRAVRNDACRAAQRRAEKDIKKAEYHAEQDAADAVDWALYIVDRTD